MDIAQSILTVAGFIGLGVYQHYRIKSLKEQTSEQNQLLQNIKLYSDIFDPGKLKNLVGLHEKVIYEKKDFEVTKIMEKFSKQLEAKKKESHDTTVYALNTLADAVSALLKAMTFVPHEMKKRIVAEMKDGFMKNLFEEGFIPLFEKTDKERALRLQQAISNSRNKE